MEFGEVGQQHRNREQHRLVRPSRRPIDMLVTLTLANSNISPIIFDQHADNRIAQKHEQQRERDRHGRAAKSRRNHKIDLKTKSSGRSIITKQTQYRAWYWVALFKFGTFRMSFVLTANPLKETGPTTSTLVFLVRFSAVTV